MTNVCVSQTHALMSPPTKVGGGSCINSVTPDMTECHTGQFTHTGISPKDAVDTDYVSVRRPTSHHPCDGLPRLLPVLSPSVCANNKITQFLRGEFLNSSAPQNTIVPGLGISCTENQIDACLPVGGAMLGKKHVQARSALERYALKRAVPARPTFAHGRAAGRASRPAG
jgi:hypothetical protein